LVPPRHAIRSNLYPSFYRHRHFLESSPRPATTFGFFFFRPTPPPPRLVRPHLSCCDPRRFLRRSAAFFFSAKEPVPFSPLFASDFVKTPWRQPSPGLPLNISKGIFFGLDFPFVPARYSGHHQGRSGLPVIPLTRVFCHPA